MNKNIISVAIAIIFLANSQLFAQHKKEIKNSEVVGFYITSSDFSAGKLTLPTDNKHKGDQIKLKQFFISPEIISIEQDKETVFYKDSIFAIRLSNGENYRFINRTPCLVADTSYVIIYTQKTVKTVLKVSGPRTLREEVPVTYYYFSTGNHKAVLMLTLANIRKYALTDTLVHKTVCDKFTTDEMLTKINTKTNRFALNETILSVLNK